METDRQSRVYPVKQTILREKKKFPRSDHRFMFFCLFIINLLTVAALLMIYHSNQYLNELTVITQNLKSDVENTANLHRLLLTKLQESDRRDKLVDVLKTFNSTSNKTRMNLSVRNWEKLETTAGIICSSIKTIPELDSEIRKDCSSIQIGAENDSSSFVIRLWSILVNIFVLSIFNICMSWWGISNFDHCTTVWNE